MPAVSFQYPRSVEGHRVLIELIVELVMLLGAFRRSINHFPNSTFQLQSTRHKKSKSVAQAARPHYHDARRPALSSSLTTAPDAVGSTMSIRSAAYRRKAIPLLMVLVAVSSSKEYPPHSAVSPPKSNPATGTDRWVAHRGSTRSAA